MPDIVHVAVAVIVNDNDEVCISLRHKDVHQGGLWEFPGGKIEEQETVDLALAREIKEELDIEIKQSRALIKIKHQYQDKVVVLHVSKVLSYSGQVKGLEGQQVKWLAVAQLADFDFPAANLAIIKAIQLPDKYLITGKFLDEEDFLRKLENALNNNIKLVQLRLKEGDLKLEKILPLTQQASKLCVKFNAKLLINFSENILKSIDLSRINFDGYHADSKTINKLSERPKGRLFSASCHNVEELEKAKQLEADFVVLSPVQRTASHPEMQAMGWQKFSAYIEDMPVPVYALGGVSAKDMETAWSHGAQGIAAISAFWN